MGLGWTLKIIKSHPPCHGRDTSHQPRYQVAPLYSEMLSTSLMKFLSGQEDQSMFETCFHSYCLDCRKQHKNIWCV